MKRGGLRQIPVQLPPIRRAPIQTRKINFHAIAERKNFASVMPVRSRLVIPSSLRSNMRQRCRRINQLCDEAESIINGIEEMIFRSSMFHEDFDNPADPIPTTNNPPKEVPKGTIKDKQFSKGEGFTECPICLSAFEDGETVGKLACGHLFHRDCVSCWICDHPSCPLCRKELF